MSEELEVTNFVLQYCLRRDHKIISVNTISAHTLEELMEKLKETFPDAKSD